MTGGKQNGARGSSGRAITGAFVMAVALTVGGCGGGGGFASNDVAICGNAQVRDVAVMDLDGNGTDDVAVGCRTRHDPLVGHLEVWLSDGSGGLERVQSIKLGDFDSGGEGAGPITAADFDEDGDPDLVVADTGGTTHGVSVLHARGGGTFGEPAYFERPITWVATSDVNGDGHQDLIPVLNMGGRYVPGGGSLIDPNGPTRVMARDTRGYQSPQQLDFNADGRTDAVIAEPRHGRLHLFPSGGKARDIVLGKQVRAVQRVMSGADVDGDGKVDLLVTTRGEGDGHETRWVLTAGGPHLSDPVSALPADASNVRAADFNGDGEVDLFVNQGYKPDQQYHGGAHPMVLMGKPGGGYREPVTLNLPGSPNGETLGDVNGDGKTDFVYRRIGEDTPQGVVYLSRM